MSYILLPGDFKPERGWVYGGLEAFVDCGPYLDGVIDWRWCRFLRIAPGTASVFPLKLNVPDRGEGQWRFDEVERYRYDRSVLEALFEVQIPPGIDREWLATQL